MAVMVYVTASNVEEAARLAETAVSERLAACANVIGTVQSIYWWDNAVQRNAEAVLILKSSEERARELVSRLRELHSYETPCIVTLPISGGVPEFLDWVRENTLPNA